MIKINWITIVAIRKILKFPDQDLRIKAKPVETFDKELKILTDDMFETMHSVNGIGLAATQIGVAKQVAVIDSVLKKMNLS